MAETGKLPRANIRLDSSRLHRARELFMPSDSTDIFVNSLEGVGVELGNRARAIGKTQGLSTAMREYVARASTLSAAISYASDRMTEVMIRHQEIGWMRTALAYETQPDVFAQVSDPKAVSWRMFMGLAIKDFHIDISSLMDALAPVVIQTKSKLESKDMGRLPGWAEIESSSKSIYRKQLADDLLGVVDSTDRWWPVVKEVRNLVTHRKHNRIIFGNSEDGLLFQVYDRSRKPKILLPQVLYQKGYNVVDFDLYSAFVIAEVVTLFDDLGTAIAPKMQVSQKGIARMSLQVVEKSVAQSIERLIQLAG